MKMFVFVYIFGLIVCATSALDFKYHSHEELTKILKDYYSSDAYPMVHRYLYSIGKSIKGEELWVMEITAARNNKSGLPNVKLIGNIHGNEAVGRELLLHFIDFLVTSYTKNKKVKWLLDNTRLHLMPTMNPDGFNKSEEGSCSGDEGRYNNFNVDLNRNFPDYYIPNKDPLQNETIAIMKWLKKIPFTLSAGLHGGALVANYPFDTLKTFKSMSPKTPSVTADNDVFIHLAKVYADNHKEMHKGVVCPDTTDKFPGGITNGAAWYAFVGGMQDYNYWRHGCMELTLEISCCKFPVAKKLLSLWEENKNALLEYSMQANRGVHGVIFDSVTKKPINATLKVVGREMNFYSNEDGEFWRILLPGKYELNVKADGYHPTTALFEVKDYGINFPQLTEIQIPLQNSSVPLSTTSTTQKTTVTTTIQQSSTDGAQIDKRENNVLDDYHLPRMSSVKSSSSRIQCNMLTFLFLVVLNLIFN